MKEKLEKAKVVLLTIIAACAIILVIQGFSNMTKDVQDVHVKGGSLSATVSGRVDVRNKVNVNLESVLGYTIGSHKSYTLDGRAYNAIDVYNIGY